MNSAPSKPLPRAREVENRKTGERIVIERSTEETGGASMVFAMYIAPGGGVPFEHYHTVQSETLRVRRGRLTVNAGGVVRTLSAGDVLEAPPFTVHSLRNDSDEEVEVEAEYRPALHSEWWLLTVHAAEDWLGRHLSLIELAPHLASGVELFPARPPRWVVRALLAVLAPVSRLLGKDRVVLDAAAAWHASHGQAAPVR